MSARSGSGESPLPASRLAPSHWVLTWWKGWGLPVETLPGALIPFTRAPSHGPLTSQRLPLQILSHWGLGFNIRILQSIQTFRLSQRESGSSASLYHTPWRGLSGLSQNDAHPGTKPFGQGDEVLAWLLRSQLRTLESTSQQNHTKRWHKYYISTTNYFFPST